MTGAAKITGSGVRLISWNTKGMNSAMMVGKFLTRLQHLKRDIMFLQKIHLKTSDTLRIKRVWMSHLFHPKFSNRARGAPIIINKRVMFEPLNVIQDTESRYVVVTGTLQKTPVILVSIYAPTWDDDQFFTRLFAGIPNLDSHRIIIGGDFNLLLARTPYIFPYWLVFSW